MKSEVTVSSPTSSSRIDRRTLLKGAAAGVAATTSRRRLEALDLRRAGVPAGHDDRLRRDRRDDAPQIQPLIDEYQAANNVTIEAAAESLRQTSRRS